MMKRIVEYNSHNKKILYPVRCHFKNIIISPKEIIYSDELRINKYTKISIDKKINKDYEVRYIDFDTKIPYIYHTIDDKGDYILKYIIFVPEETGMIMYEDFLFPKNIKEENYIVDRKKLEEIFEFNGSGVYVIDAKKGILNAQNIQNGNLLRKFNIPTDDKILKQYNNGLLKNIKGGYSKEASSIKELRDIKITDEDLEEKYIMIKSHSGNLYGTYFRIKMIEQNKFNISLKILPIINEKLEETTEKARKYILK